MSNYPNLDYCGKRQEKKMNTKITDEQILEALAHKPKIELNYFKGAIEALIVERRDTE